MANVLNSIKRFLGNKNTVTILGVVAGILVLYIGYNWQVKQAVTPVKVPYAKAAISSRTPITEDMIGYVEIPKKLVTANKNLVTNASLVVGKFVKYGTNIPANSFFYTEALMSEEEKPDAAFGDIKKGYTIYPLKVDLQTTYGNSIFPGNYIDLYFKGVDETGKIVFGKLIESIEVLAVKDSQGEHVFENTLESRTPASILFAVPDDMFDLLKKAGYISGANIEILPVPRNQEYTAQAGATKVSSDYIKEFINVHAVDSSIVNPEDYTSGIETGNE